MKLFAFLILGILVISAVEGIETRQKRLSLDFGSAEYATISVIEECPKGKSFEECKTYASNQSSQNKMCHHYKMRGNSSIEWQTCDTVNCGKYMNLLPGQDLSKSFPECCGTCKPKEELLKEAMDSWNKWNEKTQIRD